MAGGQIIGLLERRQDLNSGQREDPMDRYHREPTLAEVLSDPVTLAVMDADGVDRYDLAATLSQMAAKLMRPPGPVEIGRAHV